jgi:sarcosine oxidase subunit gamma
LTALGAAIPRIARFGALELRENADMALASLALHKDGPQPVPMGLRLPDPGGWCAGDHAGAFWCGPHQWMIEAEGRAEQDFARDLKLSVPDCAITEQTDGFVCIEITSDQGAAPLEGLMEKLVNLDVAAFGPGCATRTAFEHGSIFVIRRARTRLAIWGMRSGAESLWHALTQAAKRLEDMQ